MTRRSLNQGTEVLVECPFCNHSVIEVVVDKTTSVCDRCCSPVEVYEDGRLDFSALMCVHGPVRHGPERGFFRTRSAVRTMRGLK